MLVDTTTALKRHNDSSDNQRLCGFQYRYMYLPTPPLEWVDLYSVSLSEDGEEEEDGKREEVRVLQS